VARSERAGKETERGQAREEAERRAMEREGSAAAVGGGRWAVGEGRLAGVEEEGRRGLWMSGRQCRDAKGGIEVSLGSQGRGRARGGGGGEDDRAEWNE